MRIVIIDKSGQILYEGIPHLHGNGIKIGSGNHCDIIVNKIGIAREQIQLRFNADGYLTLQDLQKPIRNSSQWPKATARVYNHYSSRKLHRTNR